MSFERNATAAERALWQIIEAHNWDALQGAKLISAALDWWNEVNFRQPEPPARSVSHWGMFSDAA